MTDIYAYVCTYVCMFIYSYYIMFHTFSIDNSGGYGVGGYTLACLWEAGLEPLVLPCHNISRKYSVTV